MQICRCLATWLFCLTLLQSLPVEAEEFDTNYMREVVDLAKEIHEHITQTPGIVRLLDELDKSVSMQTALFSSMVDSKDIDVVLTDTQKLRKLIPPDLPVLNSQTKIEEIAGVTDGTLEGGAVQLDRLQQAGNQRQDAINKLEVAKSEAAEIAQSYSKTASTAEAVAKKMQKLVGDPVIEIIVLYSGNNFGLSWFDLETALVPALWERADAAKLVEKRLGDAITLAKKDLEGFEEARQFGERLWKTTELAVAEEALKNIRDKMEEGTKRAIDQANAWREEAKKIDKNNARIQRMQNLLTLLGSLANAGNTIGGGSSTGGSSSKSTKTTEKTVIIFDSATGNWKAETSVTQKPMP